MRSEGYCSCPVCVCVCVCVCMFIVFCHHTHVEPKYRYQRVHRNTEKLIYIYIIVVFAKNTSFTSEAKASFLLLVHIRNINMRTIHNYCTWSACVRSSLCRTQHHSQALLPAFCMYLLITDSCFTIYMHNNNNNQCKICWDKALTFVVGSIQLSFRTIVFTQYTQRCFQSKCYYISVKLCEGLHFSAFHYNYNDIILYINYYAYISIFVC